MSVGVFDVETGDTREVANKSRTAIIDSEMSEESQNPLQNRVITKKITELNQSIEELNTLLNGMDETLGSKLDVSKIANNLVTTEEGYALDARMGKALSESKINKPNYNYVIPISTSTIQSFDCNEAVQTGLYQLLNPNNAPCSGWVTIIVIPIGGDNNKYVHQLCVTINNEYDLYHRYCDNGTWTAWKSYTINS